MKVAAQFSVSYFKAHCTRILRELEKSPPESRILVTNHGRVVATVSPGNGGAAIDPKDWLGSLHDSVIRYDDPFAPAGPAGDWLAAEL
jgi:hypothetical protein